jgi:hypothetical protein
VELFLEVFLHLISAVAELFDIGIVAALLLSFLLFYHHKELAISLLKIWLDWLF